MRFALALRPQHQIFAAFFSYAACIGSLYPRLPDIQKHMAAGEGALGGALIGIAAGTLLSLTFGGRFAAKFSARAIILAFIPALSVLFALASSAPSPMWFFLLLVPVGLNMGMLELVLNVEADRVENLVGRRIMNRCHAYWSFGFFAAGLISAGFAQTGMSPTLQLSLMVPVICAITALLLSTIQAAPARIEEPEQQSVPLFAFPTLAILTLVTVSASAMVLEGAGADWSAIYMRKEFEVSPFLSGFAAAVGAGSQAFFRFFADHFVERHSPVKVARVMLFILMTGVLAVFVAPGAPFALTGFFLIGIGTSVLFPLAISAAARRTDRSAAVNVASLAQITFVLFLLAPPLLGFVAEHIGIRWAFGACLPLVAISLLATSALGIPDAKR